MASPALTRVVILILILILILFLILILVLVLILIQIRCLTRVACYVPRSFVPLTFSFFLSFFFLPLSSLPHPSPLHPPIPNGPFRFAAYGATKRSLEQFTKSLQAELKMLSISNVVVHNLSVSMPA